MKNKNRKTILVVDDTEINRSILTDMLSNEFDILEAKDGLEGIACMHEYGDEIALVLLDIVMPNMDGFEMLEIMNQSNWTEIIPVIMISAETYPSYIEKAYDLGVVDYINRPFDGRIVLRRVMNTIILYAKQKQLTKMIEQQIYEKEKNNELMIEILSHIVEFRNGESGAHVLHIRILTELLLNRLVQRTNRYHLNKNDIYLITNASALHDIGKIVVPEHILNKPGKLTHDEFEVIKKHTTEGAKMLENIIFRENEPLIQIGKEICMWHHERYDGKGYPDGLKEDEIPISAQVVSLADVYDALSSERVYKPAYSHETSLAMIKNGECGTFNPILIECLMDIANLIEDQLSLNSLKKITNKNSHEETLGYITHKFDIASQRTLHLLERERIKYQFFASMSHEVQFEYMPNPSMLLFNSWGAQYLMVNEVVLTPIQDERLIALFTQEVLEEIHELSVHSSPESPLFERNYLIHLRNQKRWHKLTVRTLWNDVDGNIYMGMIGKLVDVHDEVEKINNLENLVNLDYLTGLSNKKYASDFIGKKLSNHTNITYALILFDLDDFKYANDQYGHLFGDCVLKEVANKMRDDVKNSLLLARVGGDEFMIFIELTKIEVIHHIFAALKGNYMNFSITVSMGVALCSSGDQYESVFHHADQALYYSKKMGKNRYSIYDEKKMHMMLSGISPIDGDESDHNK